MSQRKKQLINVPHVPYKRVSNNRKLQLIYKRENRVNHQV